MLSKRRSKFWRIGRVWVGWALATPTDSLHLSIRADQKDKDSYPANAKYRWELELSITPKNPPNREEDTR